MAEKTVETGSLEHMRDAIIEYLESELTREDCIAWHNSEMTAHLRETLDIANSMSSEGFIVDIWGVKNPQRREEPLSVKVH